MTRISLEEVLDEVLPMIRQSSASDPPSIIDWLAETIKENRQYPDERPKKPRYDWTKE